MDFSKLPIFEKLLSLAKEPVDLTKDDALSKERVSHFTCTALNWKMLYATERVDETIMTSLAVLAKEAKVMEKMQRMQSMEVMNFVQHCESEERRVGHTAIRAHKGDQSSESAEKARSDYEVELQKIEKFLPQTERFKHVVVVGIGGSYLGTAAVYRSLKYLQKNDKTIDFVPNIDPDAVSVVLNKLSLQDTLVIITSKSGGTLEIKYNEEYLKNIFIDKGLNPVQHFVMITGQGSPMDDSSKYLAIFYMHDYIGGRYSVSSTVGAVPVAIMLGMEVWKKFLQGLRDMDQHALNEKEAVRNMPLLGALLSVWNRNFLGCDTWAIIPYSQSMELWSLHLEQLFMESNGKHVLQEEGTFLNYGTSPVIWGTYGTGGQHSYFQCIHQGTDIVPIEFIGFRKSQYGHDAVLDNTTQHQKLNANLLAQALSLAQGQKSDNPNKDFAGNRPSHILLADQLDPYSLGNLLSYHENVAAFCGFIWGINSFDQEGVQLGKVLANAFLDMMAGKAKEDSPLRQAFIAELEHPTHKEQGS